MSVRVVIGVWLMMVVSLCSVCLLFELFSV